MIIEIGALTEEEKTNAAKLVADTRADFIKTCTGLGPGRATVVVLRELLVDQLESLGVVRKQRFGLSVNDKHECACASCALLWTKP